MLIRFVRLIVAQLYQQPHLVEPRKKKQIEEKEKYEDEMYEEENIL